MAARSSDAIRAACSALSFLSSSAMWSSSLAASRVMAAHDTCFAAMPNCRTVNNRGDESLWSHSAGYFRAPGLLWCPPVNAFQEIAELCWRDRHRAFRRRGPDEAAALQPFREQACALTVMPDHLDEATFAPAKDEEMAATAV